MPSSGWLGDRQRACAREEAGETDAAEPGQAETGPADQATMEHAVSRTAPLSRRMDEEGNAHGEQIRRKTRWKDNASSPAARPAGDVTQ